MIVIGIAIVIALAVTLLSAVQIVPAGHMGVLLHWDALKLDPETKKPIEPPLEANLYFVVPIQDHIVPINIQVQAFSQTASSASKDLQIVTTQVTLNYHLNEGKVTDLYQQVGLGYQDKLILPAIHETVKQVTARFNAEELITQRPLVKAEIEQGLRERLAIFDIVTDIVSITEFNFSPEFNKAIESKVTAEQNALAEENIVKITEAKAKQAIAQAEGEKQSAIKRAEGEAQATLVKAEAEGKKVELINQYLSQNPQYLEWLKITQWNGVLPETLVSGDGAMPFITIPAKQQPAK